MANFERKENTKKWFCHTCDTEVDPDLTEFKCSVCGDGFIEEIIEAGDSTSVTTNESYNGTHGDRQPSPAFDQHPATDRLTQENHAPFTDSPFRFNFPPLFGSRNTLQFPPPPPVQAPPADSFYGFVEQLLFGLMGGLNAAPTTFNIQLGPHFLNGNAGDYVFSAEGIDNVVTMLMNQLEGTGPPPAAQENVEALPAKTITQAQVDDKLQCHVCMENFQLQEVVKELPCRHIYHGDCIVPWLQLHGTCPVCRKRIDANNTGSYSSSTFHSSERT